MTSYQVRQAFSTKLRVTARTVPEPALQGGQPPRLPRAGGRAGALQRGEEGPQAEPQRDREEAAGQDEHLHHGAQQDDPQLHGHVQGGQQQ